MAVGQYEVLISIREVSDGRVQHEDRAIELVPMPDWAGENAQTLLNELTGRGLINTKMGD